jgi:hypothetical protein
VFYHFIFLTNNMHACVLLQTTCMSYFMLDLRSKLRYATLENPTRPIHQNKESLIIYCRVPTLAKSDKAENLSRFPVPWSLFFTINFENVHLGVQKFLKVFSHAYLGCSLHAHKVA